MKTIGLIGGMSWESSLEYYRIINETTKGKLGGLHSAKSVMVSVDFAEIEILQQKGQWEEATRRMVICTNTMHKMVDEIQAAIHIPILHIADATAGRVRQTGLRTVGLLGTRFTMEEDFYVGRLKARGLNVRIPEEADRETVHRVIYDELCLGLTQEQSRTAYQAIIEKLVQDGAEGIILGCTEIGFLVKEGDSRVPLFDTTQIHAEAAVEYALQ
jgi:aspartate racemase